MNAVYQGGKREKGCGVGGNSKSGRIHSLPDTCHVWHECTVVALDSSAHQEQIADGPMISSFNYFVNCFIIQTTKIDVKYGHRINKNWVVY